MLAAGGRCSIGVCSGRCSTVVGPAVLAAAASNSEEVLKGILDLSYGPSYCPKVASLARGAATIHAVWWLHNRQVSPPGGGLQAGDKNQMRCADTREMRFPAIDGGGKEGPKMDASQLLIGREPNSGWTNIPWREKLLPHCKLAVRR